MRKYLIPLVVVAVMLGLFAQMPAAHAGAAGLIYKDGTTVTKLEDEDYESFILNSTPQGLPPEFSAGDLFIGMLEIQSFIGDNLPDPKPSNDPQVEGATLTGIFVLEYSGNSITRTYDLDLGGGVVIPTTKTWFQFVPTTTAWSTLMYGGVSLGLPDVEAGNAGKTIAQIYDDTNIQGNGFFTNPGADGGDGSLDSAMATAWDGTKIWEIGFAAGLNGNGLPVSANEFWYTSDVFVAPAGQNWLSSQNVTWAAPGAPVLLDHNFVFDGGADVTGLDIWSQVQISGRHEAGADSSDFTIKTDTDFWVLATPEPGSFALLGLGLAAFGGVVYRRRRNK